MERIIEQRTLSEITGRAHDVDAISPLGYARYAHDYPADLLDGILTEARRIAEYAWEARSADRYLGLRHLRAAHEAIPLVKTLMHDRERLARLSDLAGTELEPYPITRAASHINLYRPGEVPIEHHTDGAAEDGKRALRQGEALDTGQHMHIPQRTGHAVLMQGRRLLHTAEPLADGERITLVLVMRSAAEPWKDGNSLARLLLDDPIDTVREEWIADQQYQAELYRTASQ
jgi:hypothetical protein